MRDLHVPPDGLAEFQAYEDAVLPLLGDHGATLQRRLRGDDGTMEIHVIWFPNALSIETYRADPRRRAVSGVLRVSGAVAEVLTVADV